MVAHLRLTSSSQNAPAKQQDLAYKIHAILKAIHTALQGFAPCPYTSPLSRYTTRIIRSEAGIKIYEITYQFALQEIIENNMPQATITPIFNVR